MFCGGANGGMNPIFENVLDCVNDNAKSMGVDLNVLMKVYETVSNYFLSMMII